MYEYMFEVSATSYARDGRKFEERCKRLQRWLCVSDYAEYAGYVFGVNAKDMALDAAHYLTKTRKEQDKIEGDVVRLLESLRIYYEETELANAQEVATLSPEENAAYQERMVGYLDGDLKMLGSQLLQLYNASLDTPMLPEQLQTDRKPPNPRPA